MPRTVSIRALCLLVLFLAAFVAHIRFAHGACMEPTTTIISNMFLSNSGSTTYSSGSLAAEAFVTPNNGHDVRIQDIVIRVGGSGNVGQTSVEIWSSASGQPKALVAQAGVMVNPISMTDVTVGLGEPPVLAPSTTYFVVLNPAPNATVSWVYSTGDSPVLGTGALPFLHFDSNNNGAAWTAGVAGVTGRTASFMVIGCTDDGAVPPSPSPVNNAFPSISLPPIASSSPMPSPSAAPMASQSPASLPTSTPTPTPAPSHSPANQNQSPVQTPTNMPTNLPSNQPTNLPSNMPTSTPTPTPAPVSQPSNLPTNLPSNMPTSTPTPVPGGVSNNPTPTPTPMRSPTAAPTRSRSPTPKPQPESSAGERPLSLLSWILL